MYKWILALLCISTLAQSDCQIYFKNKPLTKKMNDPLYQLVVSAERCSESIHDLRAEINRRGLQERIAMVANRGRNNALQGSFSFFESVSGLGIQKGELYIGFFTGLNNSTLVLDQLPEENKLLIEVISWDKVKQLYNFYELRGTGEWGTRWFYRGNSKDAYKDNTWLHRSSPPDQENFGRRMRCSACHNSGGPILKELSSPHNDWWADNRPLILEPNKPDAEVAELVGQLVDVSVFAEEVKLGMSQIADSSKMKNFRNTLSLQERMRPLFCTTEINIESSSDESSLVVSIPSGFWLNPLLGKFSKSVSTHRYEQLLIEMKMRFPETAFHDADHRWLAPVKGTADIQAIKQLINDKIISRDFALSVLMVDFTHPVFSEKRCALLKLIPEYTDRWETVFAENLNREDRNRKDFELLLNTLRSGALDYNQMFLKIKLYNHLISKSLLTKPGLKQSIVRLVKLRNAVKSDELSQNPLGQILEPGFRVIFPEPEDRASQSEAR